MTENKEKKVERVFTFVDEKTIDAFIQKSYDYSVNTYSDSRFKQFFENETLVKELINQVYTVFVDGAKFNVDLTDMMNAKMNVNNIQAQALINRNMQTFSIAKIFNYAVKIKQTLAKYYRKEYTYQRPGTDIFNQFKAEAKTKSFQYLETFQKTEYDLIQRKLAIGEQFVKWWGDDKVELLMYRTMQDEKVRISHALLNNIIRPKKDKFWFKYTPPIEWNCRCKVKPVGNNEPISSRSDIKTFTDLIDESLVFDEIRRNTAFMLNEYSDVSVISYKHPYYKEYFKFYNLQ